MVRHGWELAHPLLKVGLMQATNKSVWNLTFATILTIRLDVCDGTTLQSISHLQSLLVCHIDLLLDTLLQLAAWRCKARSSLEQLTTSPCLFLYYSPCLQAISLLFLVSSDAFTDYPPTNVTTRISCPLASRAVHVMCIAGCCDTWSYE